MTGYIYKITNLINQKAYIGKTTNTIKERWGEHISESKSERAKNRPIYRAINKYGVENFSIELIEEVDIKELSDKEIYWIGYYDTYNNGYNATLGGDGRILYDYDSIKELIQKGYSTRQIIEVIGCCADIVHLVAKKNNLSIKKEFSDCMNPKKQVEQYDKQGNYIQSFESYAAAAQWLEDNDYVKGNLNGVRSHIGDVCKGKRKSAYKFIWKNSK